jgi:hypothetical protein
MVVIKPASELQVGDLFSTDGYRVVRARTLDDYTNRVSVELWLDASGGIRKYDLLANNHPCPIYLADEEIVVPDLPLCPACGGEEPVVLGQLGRLQWYRCRDCGIDFNELQS